MWFLFTWPVLLKFVLIPYPCPCNDPGLQGSGLVNQEHAKRLRHRLWPSDILTRELGQFV